MQKLRKYETIKSLKTQKQGSFITGVLSAASAAARDWIYYFQKPVKL